MSFAFLEELLANRLVLLYKAVSLCKTNIRKTFKTDFKNQNKWKDMHVNGYEDTTIMMSIFFKFFYKFFMQITYAYTF